MPILSPFPLLWPLALAALLQLAACASPEVPREGPTADARLRDLYEREWAWRQEEEARIRDADGDWVAAGRLPDVSAAAWERRLAYWEAALVELDAIPLDDLSHEEAINAAVFRQIIETRVSDVRFRRFEAPLNSDTFFWGGLHPRHGGFDDLDEYPRYLRRMRDLPRYFDQHMDNMRAGLERGFSVPAISLAGRDRSIEPYLQPGEDNPFWEAVASLPPGTSEAEAQRLREAAREAIVTAVVPAYRDLLRFMREEYLPRTRRSLAARELPDGEAFYRAQIRAYTTLDLTPEEIHATGLSEVDRIRREMAYK